MKNLSLEFARQTVKVLNRALKEDPRAIRNLLTIYVSCGQKLAKDPTVQTVQVSGRGRGYRIGPLGLINGIVGIRKNGYGYVAALYNIKCPVHGEERPDFKDKRVGDTCGIRDCEAQLTLGRLIRFEVLDK